MAWPRGLRFHHFCCYCVTGAFIFSCPLDCVLVFIVIGFILSQQKCHDTPPLLTATPTVHTITMFILIIEPVHEISNNVAFSHV